MIAQPADTDTEGTRRRPGRPARISRDLVVEAALDLDPDLLSVQAVAERLSVDRKAVRYYVTGRDELIEIVVGHRLAVELGRVQLPTGDWRAAIRAYARGMLDALAAERSLVLAVSHLPPAGALGPSDALIQRLTAAGFPRQLATRALATVAAVVFVRARDLMLIERDGEHPSARAISQVLADLPATELPDLRAAVGQVALLDKEQQLFDIEVVISGLGSMLDQLGSRGPEASV